MTISTNLPILPQSNLATSLKYWRRQLSFIPASETLQVIIECLEARLPGAYLRFGRADIDTALGIRAGGVDMPSALTQEIRKAFLLSGKNIFKSLHIECAALGFPPGPSRIPDREALDLLNAAGACFQEGPVYSHGALLTGTRIQPGVLANFMTVLNACKPVLVFKDGDTAFENITPGFSIALPGTDNYQKMDWLEGEVVRISAPTETGFPVVVLALGVAGRVLAQRLITRGFPGFLVDLDDLREIPLETQQTAPRHRLFNFRRIKQITPPIAPPSTGKLAVRFEGPFLGHYSFSIINRELCFRLAQNDRIELSISPNDTPFTVEAANPAISAAFRAIVERVAQPLSHAAQIHISNHVRRTFQAPLDGRWLIIQPWDYGSLPVRWVEWIQTQIDEVWVPGQFVRRAFLEAGIAPERVAVVPNGVDVRLYQPQARKVRLNTRKSFKFLYVGGPFWRKGFDILLEAYRKAFTARDDVCLVIKSAPEFWTESGTKLLADFRSQAGAPEIFNIVQALDQVRMAGVYASCDCLVHPYRAEGFAMCVAEAMASGLPVIVTGMGATADFCNPRTACLIPAGLHRMSEKKIDNMPTLDYPSYAEPVIDDLVDWMRHVYQHPHETRATARDGMNKIRAEFTWQHTAEIAIQRLVLLAEKPVVRLGKI